MSDRRGSRVGAVLAGAWSGLREGWGERAGKRGAWAATLAGGLVVGLAATWGVVALTRALDRAGRLVWEASFLQSFTTRSFPSLFDAITLAAFGASVILLPLILVVAIRLLRDRRVLTALTLPISYIGSKALTHLGWALWQRGRPELVLSGRLNPDSTPAFPSGHMLQVTALYGLLAWLWFRRRRRPADAVTAGTILVLLLAATAVSRLRVGAHWPTDVIAGLLLGGLWAAANVVALRHDRDA